jgi:ankyrin repeat protein
VIHRAAERGNQEAVEFLLSTDPRRADVQSFTKRPALHCAAHNGHTDICKMLLEANADVSCC